MEFPVSIYDPRSGTFFSATYADRTLDIREGNPATGITVDKREVADEDEARAIVEPMVLERRGRGWLGPGESVERTKPVEPAHAGETGARGALLTFLESGEARRQTGKRSPAAFLDVPLRFDRPEKLEREELSHFSMLQDWKRRRTWPEDVLPLAVYSPVTDEDESTFAEASGSEVEEHFAIGARGDGPVYLWTADAGLEQIAPSLGAFLAKLR